MNRLSVTRQAQIVGLLCEVMTLRATARLSGASLTMVIKLIEDMGDVAQNFQDRALRGLSCLRVQLDEIWAFCYAKQKNVPPAKQGQAGYGDIWTWTAIVGDSKLVVARRTKSRGGQDTNAFVADLASRLTDRAQITSDVHNAYLRAVEESFGADVDFAQLVKLHGHSPDSGRRYSPSECIGAERHVITGQPDWQHISTSFVERQNLNIRMHNRRFTRLSNAFSKKAENHARQFVLQTLHHNFARSHRIVRVTPAMEAGIADHVWSLEEMAELLVAIETNAA